MLQRLDICTSTPGLTPQVCHDFPLYTADKTSKSNGISRRLQNTPDFPTNMTKELFLCLFDYTRTDVFFKNLVLDSTLFEVGTGTSQVYFPS